MRIPRTAVPVVALVLLALSACGTAGSPTPGPSGSPTETAGPTGSPSASPVPTPQQDVDEEVVAATVVVTGSTLSVFGTDGSTLAALTFGSPVDGVVATLGSLLGAPAVTTTAGTGSGCDTDQTMYDFGGVLIRTPGHIGATGGWEAEITAASTGTGLPISTVGGLQVGANRATFESAIGDEVLVGDYPPTHWYGFDVVNPAVDEYEHIGMLARFDSDALAQLNAPHLIYADC